MARKSRKNINEIKFTEIKFTNEKIYNVGIYIRLSKINALNDDDTLVNQKNIILNYIKDKKEFKIIDIYEDTNKTGTNFNRNGFEKLLEDVKIGKIDCIIVKDLSRFGRNYIECCNYIEKIFPFINVRFIAINDNYDSINENSNQILTISLKNIVNEMYAKDISKKVYTALHMKKLKGEFTGSYASYGYLKDPNHKNKIIVNNETAPIVQKIFDLRLKGYSYTKIAIMLNEENILSPIAYLYSKNIVRKKIFENSKWNFNNVKTILLNEIYIGNMVQGKKKCIAINNAKRTNKDDWIIAKATHQPIIEKDVFYKVQEINKKARKDYEEKNQKPKKSTENIFKSIVKCGECGKRLVRRENTYKNCCKPSFACKSHNIKECKFTSFKEADLKEIVFNAIKNQINVCTNLDNLLKEKESIIKFEEEKLNKSIKNFQKELSKIRNSLNTIYEDYAENLLSKDDYILIKNTYIEKEKYVLQKINSLEEELKYTKNTISKKNKFLSTFLSFKNEKLLTKILLEMLISEIVIYQNKTIDIKFNFVDEYKELMVKMESMLNEKL